MKCSFDLATLNLSGRKLYSSSKDDPQHFYLNVILATCGRRTGIGLDSYQPLRLVIRLEKNRLLQLFAMFYNRLSGLMCCI